MKTHVTVIPSDGIISVDGEVLFLDGIKSETFHALQWHDGAGHVEPNDGLPNEEISSDDYEERVAPFVALWEEEKARLEQAAAEAEAAGLAEYNSEAARLERLRAERDQRLSATDYLLMPDYPLNDTLKEAMRLYRQALRDLPSQEGAPWDGGSEETPWPLMPELASFVSLS
nr:MAG TPA: tail assembly chaperone protein [Caudoviricetes sp.]